MRIGAALLAAALPALPGADGALERAREQYEKTDYAAALKTLDAIPQKDAAVYELIGKSLYMQGEFKRASQAFEKAVKAQPSSSTLQNWLGRAYGRRAETASFISAPGLASKARACFERAVELDPKNLDAVSDLFEYYLEAPGFMGGGLDKAEALARRVQSVNPAEHHYMLARVAEKRKQYPAAEEQLRRAIQAAPRQVGRVLDLAKFLALRGRTDESEAAFKEAERLAPGAPKVMFARANTYVQTGRNLDTARALLRQYLQSPLTPDDPPRSEAERLLKKLSDS